MMMVMKWKFGVRKKNLFYIEKIKNKNILKILPIFTIFLQNFLGHFILIEI